MNQHQDRPDCSGCLVTGSQGMHGDRALAPTEEGIGRRTFLAQSGILAAMALLGACGASSDATAPNVPANSQIDVSNYPALANVGGVALVSLNGPVAIVRTGASSFVALSRICPHQGGTVNQQGSDWVCPNHGATFTLDGTWIGGQPTSNMHQYSTTYDTTTNTLTIS